MNSRVVGNICVLILILFVVPVYAGNNIVLLMDNSGSMRKNDPDLWSKSSAEFFVERCSVKDRVGIIPFDSSRRNNKLIKLANPVKEHDRIISFIENMDYKGPWTDYYWALSLAYKQLKDVKGNKYVVLFSDGEPDPDRKDKLYKGMKKHSAAKKNKALTRDIIKKLYLPNDIKIFTIAFTNKSDIRFLKAISSLSSGRHDFGFQVDNSYGLSEVFLRISNLIPALSTSFTYGIFVPPDLSKDFLLINLDKRVSRRNYTNQVIMETLSQFSALSGRKDLSVSEYSWPELSEVQGVGEVVQRFSKIQNYLLILDFKNNAQSGEYYVYDFTRKNEPLVSHKKWHLGILSILCERMSQGIFEELKGYKMKKEVTYPVSVRHIGTKQPAIAKVTFFQNKLEKSQVTNAFGHTVFVGLEDEAFRMVFRKSGVKLGEWTSNTYTPDKVFYINAAFDVSIKAYGIPFDVDDLVLGYKTPRKRILLKADAELYTPGNIKLSAKTTCTFKKVPIGIRKLRINFSHKEGKEAYLPFIEYISISQDKLNKETHTVEKSINLDKNYVPLFQKLVKKGDVQGALSRLTRLLGLHRDHPQVFDITYYISNSYRKRGDFREALEVLLMFAKKYRDNFFYRKVGGVVKDRFYLLKAIGELKLAQSQKERPSTELGEKKLLNIIGLTDLKNAEKFYIQSQNSIMPSQHIKPSLAMEYFLLRCIAEYQAEKILPNRKLGEYKKYLAKYKKISEKQGLNLSPSIYHMIGDGGPLFEVFNEIKAKKTLGM